MLFRSHMSYNYEYIKTIPETKVSNHLSHHNREISHIAWIEPSNLLVSADYAGHIKIWDQSLLVCKQSIEVCPSNAIRDFKICDKNLYLGSFDGFMRIIDIEKGKVIQKLVVGDKITCICLNSPKEGLVGTLGQGIFKLDLTANKVIQQLYKPTLFTTTNDIIYASEKVCISSVHPMSPVLFDSSILAWDISSVAI